MGGGGGAKDQSLCEHNKAQRKEYTSIRQGKEHIVEDDEERKVIEQIGKLKSKQYEEHMFTALRPEENLSDRNTGFECYSLW